MISKVSDILNGFLDEEKRKLDQFALNHAPTIGSMYEGLTTELLNKAIPPQLGLGIESGVIFDDTGTMTGQIDCMLVKGSGLPIPYTGMFKWHIKDVIAVFEVKKNLYAAELKDSFSHLKEVLNSYSRYVEKGPTKETFNISSVLDIFAKITSIVPPKRKEIESLGFSLEMLYHTLVMEHLSPIRIVLGYHGYKSEAALRKCLIDFLSENGERARGFGVGSFPQLIISDRYSLIKLNGEPYSVPLQDDEWIFYASARSNPVLLILEFIWTRLSRLYKIGGLWGEDLELESFVPLLKGKAVQASDMAGWAYHYDVYDEDQLRNFETSYEWEPTFLNTKQFTIINRLCMGRKENIRDPELISYIEEGGESFDVFLKSLLDTQLVGLRGEDLELITEECQCAILPDGRFVAAENNTGRFTRWCEKNIFGKNANE
jgi:hypothetical protein